MKKISVCMATFNGEKYIRTQLLSILAQLDLEDEVVISDNCSTDKTICIINSFNDARIRLISFEKKSVVANFENALKHSSGDYIILADQDDFWMEGRVDDVRNRLETYNLVISNCSVVNEMLLPLDDSSSISIRSSKGIVNNLISNSFIGCCMAFDKSMLPVVLPFPSRLSMHDWWIGLMITAVGRVHYETTPRILYRRHSANLSNTGGVSNRSLANKILIRIYITYHLFKRVIFIKLSSKLPIFCSHDSSRF